jgi:hypothetical protein
LGCAAAMRRYFFSVVSTSNLGMSRRGLIESCKGENTLMIGIHQALENLRGS